ncbi:MAG: glycosyltransferase family 2 protein [Deltaproteobacteria bacterium]|nr:glycosyltransferase family 2 protein [Deltaproteobacteria bacterium]
MTLSRPKISVAIIAKNEGDRIARLLKSVQFADEIVVVDSGSNDNTVPVCKDYGAEVIYQQWQGHTLQKQFAMEQTSSEWILCLDADEEVSVALGKEIRHNLDHIDLEVNGFSMPRLSRYLGRWIRHGGWYPDRKVRIVRRGTAVWCGTDPHDKLIVKGKVVALSEPLLHYTYRSIRDQVATINNFSDIFAGQHGPAGNVYILAGTAHFVGKFLECYVWKTGFLDGIPGFIIAANSAWYVFLKHAKAWELKIPPQKSRRP